MPGGFTEDGLAALDAALAGHVVPGEGANTVPGLVALVVRGGQVHVTTAGHKALGDGEPIGRDAIFRIASLTKPIVGAAAMLLIEDGAMALDDPVHRWLPELSDRRVLRRFDAELTDTVPAARAITVEDALSFRLGFGCVFAPGPLPIAQAEASLGLKTLGSPWPPTPLTPDDWIAGLGRLPLIDQPGEVRYGGTTPEPQSRASWSSGSRGRRSPRCSASGYSSRSAWRIPGSRCPPPSWVGSPACTRRMARVAVTGTAATGTASTAEAARPACASSTGPTAGMMSVPAAGSAPTDPTVAAADGLPRGYGWDGGSGTTWRTDPATGLTGILLTQRMMTSPEPPQLTTDFWSGAYAAMAE